ncbi:MAG: hypothetical protein DRO39_01935 [Thermoprotei archaeon]|nr:MAG: hypothetical protein DRO39_01935 [Thermoprotei archaeon]
MRAIPRVDVEKVDELIDKLATIVQAHLIDALHVDMDPVEIIDNVDRVIRDVYKHLLRPRLLGGDGDG